MKFDWGKRSRLNMILLCHPMQKVLNRALELGIMDFSIVETYRGQERQDEYFEAGKSRVLWPKSKHNVMLSEAADCFPWINGKLSYRKVHCCVLAGIILAAAAVMGVRLRWGGNWDMDSEPITDQDFQDLGHYEVVDG